MLIDNRRILQKKNKILLSKLEQLNELECKCVQAKNGEETLVVTLDSKEIYYHSRYNPRKEAAAIIESQLKEKTEYVLLIGVGLGYIVQELIDKHPNIHFSIYEPNIDVISIFLSKFELKKIRKKNFDIIFNQPSELQNQTKFYSELMKPNSQIIVNPVVDSVYNDELTKLMNNLKKHLQMSKKTTITDLTFQLRWTTNSIMNLQEVMSSPNFFNDINIDVLKNKPALIVAAGPSLDNEIENIRLIKEEGRAYIFAVGSAVNTLIKYNIMPDALFSYDPTAENNEVVRKIKELELKIPLIFGSTIGYEVLKGYPGDKIHFITSQDSIIPNLISEKSPVIPDAPTIAAVALYILGGIKMAPIILVGQNLSETKEKKYADGIEYFGENRISEEEIETYKIMKSTTGEDIYTNEGYLSMKKVIEFYIEEIGLHNKIYNTTKNGLPIEGAPFRSLNSLFETDLKYTDIVDTSIFIGENAYRIEEVIKQFEIYETNFDDLIRDFKRLVSIDASIRESYEKKLINNLKSYFNDFDKYFNRIEKNKFFLQTLAPITRAQYKQLVSRSTEVREEVRPLKKIEKYLDIYSKYIQTMYVGIIQIQPAFAELKKSDLFKKEDSK